MKHIPKLVLTYVFGHSRLPHSVLLSVFFNGHFSASAQQSPLTLPPTTTPFPPSVHSGSCTTSVLYVLCALSTPVLCVLRSVFASLPFSLSASVLCVLYSLCNQFSVVCAHFAISSLCFVLTFLHQLRVSCAGFAVRSSLGTL